ncbi:tetratricopeptide repeat protein [Nocardioides korecus]
MPEIREQAYDVARAVVRGLHGESRRRPRDLLGLTLTASRRAATAYDVALGRLLRLQDGVEEGLERAVALDPGFAQAHAALALLGHEWGEAGSWRSALAAAHAAASERHLDDREVSFLDAVTTRLRSDEATGAAALLRHVRLFPRDALAVGVALPTVAFGGLTSGSQTADLVESLGRAYGDDWWYAGQLAFVRQDQGRWAEAEALADHALSVEPASGHAVHARAHVLLETGRHAEGLAWLDGWIRSCGRDARHRSHFSWHAALHELALGDVEAVGARYVRELAPPAVTGSRALVDSAALLWRCRVTGVELPAAAAPSVRAAAPDGWLISPPTPFAALHAALALAVEDDAAGLAALRATSLAHADPVFREVLAPVCRALQSVVEGDHAGAATVLRDVLPRTGSLGGSAAQREVLEDTLVHALARSGRGEEAARVLDRRLHRRPSVLDARLRDRARSVAGRTA